MDQSNVIKPISIEKTNLHDQSQKEKSDEHRTLSNRTLSNGNQNLKQKNFDISSLENRNWLADQTSNALMQLAASKEREHIVALINRSKKMYLSDNFVSAASQTASQAPETIEKNLDQLEFADEVVWFEFDHDPRTKIVDANVPYHRPKTIGCLLAVDPSNPDHIVIFVAWQFENKNLHHSYALMHWKQSELWKLALDAPDVGFENNFYSFVQNRWTKLKNRLIQNKNPTNSYFVDNQKDDNQKDENKKDVKISKNKLQQSNDRLMSAAQVNIPPGFLSEMEIWEGYVAANDPRLHQATIQTQKDVSGEHIFLLAVKLLLSTSLVSLQTIDPEKNSVDFSTNDLQQNLNQDLDDVENDNTNQIVECTFDQSLTDQTLIENLIEKDAEELFIEQMNQRMDEQTRHKEKLELLNDFSPFTSDNYAPNLRYFASLAIEDNSKILNKFEKLFKKAKIERLGFYKTAIGNNLSWRNK